MQLISRRDICNCFGLADRIHTALVTHGSAMHLHLPPPAACLPDARIRLYRFSGGLVDVIPDEGVESSRHLSGPLRARPRAPNHTLDFSGPPKTTTEGVLQSGL